MKKIFLTAFLAINIFAAYAQSFTLRGTVVDKKDEPMVGVVVNVKRTSIATVTDADGGFAISLPDTTKYKNVVFSFVGYKMQEYNVNTKKNYVQIVMEEDDIVLHEVLVSAYAKTERSYFTGSVERVEDSPADIRSIEREESVKVSKSSKSKEKSSDKKEKSSPFYDKSHCFGYKRRLFIFDR